MASQKQMLLSAMFAFLFMFIPVEGDEIVYPDIYPIINVKTAFGAKGDGVTDDTAVLEKVVEEYKGKMCILYFPKGTYILSNSIGIFGGKAHSRDRFISWEGESREATVLKLKDKSPGFDNSGKPKIMISVYNGQSTGDVMQSYFKNMTIDIGSGNPGAIGLCFFTNNVGALEDVTIKSSDPSGAGAIGLDLSQSQNGPGLIRNVSVVGFDKGIIAKNSFSLVLEHISLENQKEIAFHNYIARITVRDLKINGAPVAIHNGKHADLFLIDGDFKSAQSNLPAIVLEGKNVFLRYIRQSGYKGIVKNHDGTLIEESELKEWSPAPYYQLFEASRRLETLRLEVKEPSHIPYEKDLSKWFTYELPTQGNDISDSLQKAIDEAVLQEKTTLYFNRKLNKAMISKPIRVHGSISRIHGMMSEINISDPLGEFEKGKAVFTFENLKTDTIVVERFFLLGGWKCPAHITMFENKSGKTVYLKDAGIAGQMKKSNPGGLWFIDNISPSRTNTLLVGKNETVWLRQYNPESPKSLMIDVDGGQLWLLGLKTEGRSTHLFAKNNARVEILGGVAYQSWSEQPLDPPMFIIDNSQVSVGIGFYHYKDPFKTIIEEIYDGTTKTLDRVSLSSYFLPLYRSAK